MHTLLLYLSAVTAAPVPAQDARTADLARWKREARAVTITRDDWGIPHIYGKTDADAVFGMAYAQAEDDFNRVETNYLNAMGRLAEAEGKDKVYQDLRMKMFIDPEDLKKEYAASPEWLRKVISNTPVHPSIDELVSMRDHGDVVSYQGPRIKKLSFDRLRELFWRWLS